MALLIPQIDSPAASVMPLEGITLEGLALDGLDSTRMGLDGQPVPLLRGRLHQVSVLPVSIAGTMLTLLSPGITAQLAAALFTASIVAMLSASAFYHCHAHTWSVKLQARKIDHSMIFVAIAGSESAFWLVGAPLGIAIPASVIIWIVAAAGIRHKLTRLTLTGTTGSWLFGALGWASVMLIPFLIWAGQWSELALIVAGGVVYSVGSRLLSSRPPSRRPRIYGYHEVWHMLVVAGVIAHGIAFAGLSGVIS